MAVHRATIETVFTSLVGQASLIVSGVVHRSGNGELNSVRLGALWRVAGLEVAAAESR